MTWCVYAITNADAPSMRIRGIDGERVRHLQSGSLAALVGHIRQMPPPAAEHLSGFHRLQGRLFEELPAVLPVQYGTIVESLEELRTLLAARDERLRGLLRLVRNRAQMTVRLPRARRGDEPVVRSQRPARSAAAAREGAGIAYLRSRAAAAALERRAPEFEPLRDAVAGWVRAERVSRGERLVSVYHLVPRSAASAYRRALDRRAAGTGVEATVTGPFPAFAFADPEP